MRTFIKISGVKCRLFALSAFVAGFGSPGVASGEIQFEPATIVFPGGPTQEGGPSLSRDGLTLYFQRGNLGNQDIWKATRTSRFGVFGAAVSLGPNVNSSGHEAGASISDDALSLFFTSTRPGGQGPEGTADIYVAMRVTTNEDFGMAVNLGEEINSPYSDGQPEISTDGLTLLFFSDRPGGFSAQDLYMATRPNPSLPFGDVVSLGATVNHFVRHGSPSMSADGLSLFFIGSDGATGDIYVSTRASLADSWGDPVNLGPNVNGPTNDDWVDIAWDGLSITFGSNSTGSYRVYEARSATQNLVLVEHPYPIPPTTENYGIWQASFSATDNDPGTGRQGNRVYDSFNLPLAAFSLGADIRTVRWVMGAGDGEFPTEPPGPLEATSYRINFWANDQIPGLRDQPGAELFSLEVPAASVHFEFAGISAGLVNFNNYAYYHVSLDLPQPFHAAPDTPYWMSWMAFTPTFQPAYGAISTVSGGQMWQDRLGSDGNMMARLDRTGNTLAYSLEGTATPPGFAAWIAGFELTGANAAADADSDSDGLESGAEYILGGNPKVSSTVSQPTAALVGETLVFTFSRTDTSETPDVTVAVRTSSNLTTWPTVYTVGQDTASSSPGVSILENEAAPDAITVTIPRGTAPLMFARLVVAVRL